MPFASGKLVSHNLVCAEELPLKKKKKKLGLA
jgi:hypothetical protein